MKLAGRLLFILFCLAAALACYGFGVPTGGTIFLVLGFVFEGLFWTGIFGRRKKPSPQTEKA